MYTLCHPVGTPGYYSSSMLGEEGTKRRQRRVAQLPADAAAYRSGDAVPNVFGTVESTQLLALLSLVQVTCYDDLIDALHTTPEAMSRRVRRLVQHGLVKLYLQRPRLVALDERHPCSVEILALALTIARGWLKRPHIKSLDTSSVLECWSRGPYDLNKMLGDHTRTHLLTALSALGRVPITQFANLVSLRRESVRISVSRLALHGLVGSDIDRCRNFIALDPLFFAHHELVALLNAYRRINPRYDSLATLYAMSSAGVPLLR